MPVSLVPAPEAVAEAGEAEGLRNPTNDDCLILAPVADLAEMPGGEEEDAPAAAVTAVGNLDSGLGLGEGDKAGGGVALLGRWRRGEVMPRFPGAA